DRPKRLTASELGVGLGKRDFSFEEGHRDTGREQTKPKHERASVSMVGHGNPACGDDRIAERVAERAGPSATSESERDTSHCCIVVLPEQSATCGLRQKVKVVRLTEPP